MNRPMIATGIMLSLCAAAAHAGVLSYHLTDLGTLGGIDSIAYAISPEGEVVGQSSINPSSNRHAFAYGSGIMTDIGVLDGYTNSTASAVNSSGQIVGYAYTPGPGPSRNRAFSYSNGIMTDLGTLGGSGSRGLGIDAAGNVVGAADTTTGNQHAFYYSSGTMNDLGTLGGSGSVAYGINSENVIVGSANISDDSAYHAFSYFGGTMRDLGTLGGDYSAAYSINEIGQIVGYSVTNKTQRHAALFSGGGIIDLGTLGGSSSEAYGINSAGQIVGYAGNRAFLYTNGTMYDLNSTLDGSGNGCMLLAATSINDSGWIVGYGTSGEGDVHAVLLSPVPEPLTMSALLLPLILATRFARVSRQR